MFGFFKKRQGPESIPSMGVDIMNARIDNVRTETSPLMPMQDPIDEPEPQKKGLQIKWEVGERIPWKGIWFRVSRVDEGRLELIPESMTWKRQKAVEASKASRS